MTKVQSIPSYNLFGEFGDLPDIVHCETIETRSALHDWQVSTHRHARLHQVLLVQDGGGEVHLDGQRQDLSGLSLVNIPVGVVHGFEFIPKTRGLVVTLATEMIDDALHLQDGLRGILNAPQVLQASEGIVATMVALNHDFNRREFARAQILRAQAGVLLGRLARAIYQAGFPLEAGSSRGLVQRFEELIEAHLTEQWSVAEYAKALNISPTHLSRLARQATGRPASRLIEDRMIREARRNLVYTALPVSRIAYMLGYDDPAYFSRVFTRATGQSPRAFRQRADRADQDQ